VKELAAALRASKDTERIKLWQAFETV